MRRVIKYDFVGFLRASRIPNLLIIGSTQYLAIVFLVSPFAGKERVISSLGFFMMVVSTLLIAAGGYIINDYFDQKIDMVNRPEKVVVGTLFRRRLAMVAHLILTLLGIGLGFYIKPAVGIVHLFSSFSLWHYSNSLRRLPIIGNLTIAFMAGLSLLLIPVYLGRNEMLVYIYAVLAMAIVLIREVIKDIEDVKGDATFGCQSIPVVWGVRGAKVFIYIVIFGGTSFLLTFLVLIKNPIVQYYFLFLMPLFGYFILKLARADRQKEYNQLTYFTNLIIFTGLISMFFI